MLIRDLGTRFSSITFRYAAALVFIIAFALRTIPEILAGMWPLGFDTVTYYVPIVMRWATQGVSFAYMDSYAPLSYLILFLTYLATKNMFLSLKLLGPLFYGLLSFSLFYFAAKGLNWSLKKSFLGTLLFSFYFVTLRIGWDLYRNMLGLALLLLLLPFLIEFDTQPTNNKLLASLLMIMVVLSHEIAGILALLIGFGTLLWNLVRKKKTWPEVFKLSSWFVPSLFIFLLITFVTAVTLQMVPGAINYLTNTERAATYGSYYVLAFDVLGLFYLAFGVLLPFIAYGFWRNPTLDLWSFVCFAGAFWPLLSPWFEIIPWNRWMYMLDVPLILYTINGLDKLRAERADINVNLNSLRRFSRMLLFLILIVSVAAGFLVLPQGFLPQNLSSYPYFKSFQRLSFYIPGGMYSNSFPIYDNEALVKNLQWVNNNMNNQSVLIIHESLTGWVSLYLDDTKNVINYHFRPPQTGLQTALTEGFRRIYLIWWTNDYGWYDQARVPVEFGQPVFVSSKIGVYLYASP